VVKVKLKPGENKIEFKTKRMAKTVLKSIYPAGSFLLIIKIYPLGVY